MSEIESSGEPCYNAAVIIDFHTHIFPPWLKADRAAYFHREPLLAVLYDSPRAKMATAEDLVASMDADGVDVSVALNFAWTTRQICARTNDYIMESVARYPGRLVGFCTVPLRFPDFAVREIERCASGGIRGVGELRPDPRPLLLGGVEEMQPLVEEMVSRGLVCLTHASEPVGHRYPGKDVQRPEVLYRLITAFPELKLVCAHWGGGLPFYALMPEVKRAMANVFFDTAASPFLYTSNVYTRVAQLVGADKVLFGSDNPLLPPRRLIKEVQSLDLPEVSKKAILGGNAARLLDIPTKETP